MIKNRLAKRSPLVFIGWILLCLIIFNKAEMYGQNLIPNPSFENFNHYTGGLAQTLDTSKTNFYGVTNWWSATLPHSIPIQSDSLERWRGHLNLLNPHSGQAHAWIAMGGNINRSFPGGKAFYQTLLIDSLNSNCYYHLVCYFFPLNVFKEDTSLNKDLYAANRFGFFFSKKSIRDTAGLGSSNFRIQTLLSLQHFLNQHIQPQVELPSNLFITDTTQYTQFDQVFKAEGGERYLTMGNFHSMSSTLFKNIYTGNIISTSINDTLPVIGAALFIDDLSLIKVPPPDTLLSASSDTTICPGDTLWLSAFSRDTASGIIWDNGSTDSLRPITAPGTYWVQLDCGCDLTLTDTIVVKAYDSLPQLSPADTLICRGQTLTYSLPPALTYALNGTAVPPAFNIQDSGVYNLAVDNGCYQNTYSFRVSFQPASPLPDVKLNDTTLCDGQQAEYAFPKGFAYELNGLSTSENIVLQEPGDYSLRISNGCKDSILNFTIDDEGCQTLLFVPNAFTPNQDGLNDCFEVSVIRQKSYHITIFNRWGQLVYESNDAKDCWNGRYKDKAVFGVFTYKIIVDSGSEKIHRYGTVSVLR